MKKKSVGRKTKKVTEDTNDDDSLSSCQTRRKIEDMHELRRYQDELGVYEEEFDLV